MFNYQQILLVFIGGGIGSITRFITTSLIGARFGTVFPFGTLFVNIVGSFFIGFIMFFAIDENFILSEPLRLLLVIGFIGGFTTFSSFSMETLLLFRGTSIFYAFVNIAANLIIGLAAVYSGITLAGFMNS